MNNAYPGQLGGLLGIDYTVMNYGVSGTTVLTHGDFPYWSESFFVNAKNFNPPIVIIEFGTNDSKPQNWAFKNEFFPNPFNPATTISYALDTRSHIRIEIVDVLGRNVTELVNGEMMVIR